ncbi:MAG TPA: glutaminyl-peptide cyclotransferase [Verrucomicrobiae bacterium]
MRPLSILAVLLASLGAGCGQQQAAAPAPSSIGQGHPPAGEVWRYSYEVIKTFPHDKTAFTQGLVFLGGKLIESTGLNGHSTLREVDLSSGRVLRQAPVPEQYFAEGLAVLGGKAYQLTWQSHKGFVYDEANFHLDREFSYPGEGWGLATDGHSLIMSDGTAQIRFLDPAKFEVARSIQVTYHGQPVNQLNELEYVQGEIFANVWQTACVVRIDPASGAVTGVIDFTGLLQSADRDATTDVLNGIAYDSAGDRLFVTGKMWPKLFQVRLTRITGAR